MRNTRLLVSIQDGTQYRIVGRVTEENVGPRMPIVVPQSPEGGMPAPGGKCEHGVYIPAPYLSTDRAPDCSICRPFEILVRDGVVYKA